MNLKNILIVEDDELIRNELKELLENSGYKAEILTNFKNSLDEILSYSPDLLLLDINIPFLNGQMLLQNLRKVSDLPVIMVTSKNNEVDEVLAMSYGADDYITKPYNPTLLLLRIAAIFKRMDRSVDKLTYKELTLIPGRGIVKSDSNEVELTKNELIIFQHLLNYQGTIVSRDDLMTTLWNSEEYISENALTVNISRLRAKLSELGHSDAIETKKGQGYLLR
ncbi:hypothetical protein P261_01276 [Lachnospiraceae bacterium TWA4]|nr:hypothetical protein P261_01276 [Lachnospiraceae bacterium TWA4]